jgi:4-amino-4-deoxy-L-arabinose transferase-like glycosyltransferase
MPDDSRRPSLGDALLEPRVQPLAIAAVAALIVFGGAGGGHLANYDDCYYAEKAREMLRSGDWVTPHFAGQVRLDNPPLFLWIIAACFRVMGQSDWAAIFGSALSGLLCVVLLHRLARRLGGDTFQAFGASVVLLTTGYFIKYSGHAMVDVFLTLLFVLAMLAYRRAWDGSLKAWAALGALAGLGVLTKSVLGLFPLLVVGAHLVWSGRARTAFAGAMWLSLAVTLLVIAPWYGAQLHLRAQAFLHEHVSWLLWERGFVLGRGQQTLASRVAYVTEIAGLYWPWLPFAGVGLVTALRRAFAPAPAGPAWDERATSRLLVLWPVIVIGVMSLGNEKKLWYVMSVFPALALLSARAAGAWVRSAAARRRVVLGGLTLLACAGAALALTPWFDGRSRRPDLQVVAHAARTLVPEGETVMLPDGDYASVANQFIYYSGRWLGEPMRDSARVRARLARGEWGLFTAAQRARYVGADSLAYPVVAASGGWSLVHAAPRPPVVLEPSDPFE